MKVTELVKLIQLKISETLKECGSDVQLFFDKFKDDLSSIASSKDLDYLFAWLKGDGSELLKALE